MAYALAVWFVTTARQLATSADTVANTAKMTEKKRGGAGRNQGRKPLTAGAESVVVTTRMSEAQRDKRKRLGGAAWERKQIDEAKETG